jgi:uncharacterized membrane protein
MIASVTFGGGLAVRMWIGLLAIMSLTSLSLALYNIKRLQIDQHRAWMLRAWFYVSLLELPHRLCLTQTPRWHPLSR